MGYTRPSRDRLLHVHLDHIHMAKLMADVRWGKFLVVEQMELQVVQPSKEVSTCT
jgi:hypothetical protein